MKVPHLKNELMRIMKYTCKGTYFENGFPKEEAIASSCPQSPQAKPSPKVFIVTLANLLEPPPPHPSAPLPLPRYINISVNVHLFLDSQL